MNGSVIESREKEDGKGVRRRRGGSKEGKDRFRVHSYRTLETPIPGLILEMPNDRIEPPPFGGEGVKCLHPRLEIGTDVRHLISRIHR